MSMVIYEAPNRVAETLADLLAAWGDRPALVARELTKIHEELVRGSLSELAGRGEESWRGEVVMVVEGADPATQTLGDPADLELELKRLLQDGTRPIKEIARQLADSAGVSRKMVYDLALKLEGKK
jgi:16S rRNA (cytidine1402-2'-O)-methyltransferase